MPDTIINIETYKVYYLLFLITVDLDKLAQVDSSFSYARHLELKMMLKLTCYKPLFLQWT